MILRKIEHDRVLEALSDYGWIRIGFHRHDVYKRSISGKVVSGKVCDNFVVFGNYVNGYKRFYFKDICLMDIDSSKIEVLLKDDNVPWHFEI